MTEVMVVGDPADERTVRQALFSYETARRALSAYDVTEPFVDTIAVETISLGQAVSLLEDLDWYLARVASEALVREPSIDADEWLARSLARGIRAGEVDAEATGEHLKLYGIAMATDTEGPPLRELVEPMYVTRTDRGVPSYDLRDVEETLVVRVPPEEVPGRATGD
ncbi:MAG: DUF5804 family protein [Halobacteriaceae archaeon]